MPLLKLFNLIGNPFIPFSGEKSAIHWFRNYLVIVTQDGAQASVSGRSTVRSGEPEEKGKYILSIFDLQNKFIAYTAPVRTIMALVYTMFFQLDFGKIKYLMAKLLSFYKLNTNGQRKIVINLNF